MEEKKSIIATLTHYLPILITVLTLLVTLSFKVGYYYHEHLETVKQLERLQQKADLKTNK